MPMRMRRDPRVRFRPPIDTALRPLDSGEAVARDQPVPPHRFGFAVPDAELGAPLLDVGG
jgi:hypothetical protein